MKLVYPPIDRYSDILQFKVEASNYFRYICKLKVMSCSYCSHVTCDSQYSCVKGAFSREDCSVCELLCTKVHSFSTI